MDSVKIAENIKWLQPSMDASRDVIIHLNAQENVIALNKTAAALFKENLLGKHLLSFAESKGMEVRFDREKLSAGENFVELDIQYPNHWTFKGHINLCELGKGDVGYIVSGFQQHYQPKTEEKASDPWIGNIIQHMPGFVCWKDTSGIILGCNQNMADAAGVLTPNDLLGKTDFDCPWKSNAALIQASDNKVIQLGQPQTFEEVMPLSKGEIKQVLSNKIPLRDQLGAIIGVVSIMTDISELKRVQDELKKEKARAESANHAKAEFLANVSSALRTPLNTIIGTGQLLNLASLPIDTKEKIHDMTLAGQSLLTLVDDVLNFSRLDAGIIEYKAQAFDLRKLFEELSNSLAYLSLEKQIPLIVSYREDLPRYLIGDPLRVRQILTNLISNALKFTTKGHVLITADCAHWVGDQVIMKITIEDTGMGISPDQVATIFEKEKQPATSYVNSQKRTGLGLIVVKKFVEGMGGMISVHSQVNKGSTFLLSLPFVAQHPANDEDLWSRDYSALKTLIVDNYILRGEVLLKQVPGAQGRCVTAATALSEVQQAQQKNEPYHIIFVDQSVQEPFISHFSTELKQLSKFKPLLILITDVTEAGSAFPGYFRLLARTQQTRWLQMVQDSWDKWSAQTGGLEQLKQKLKVLLVEDNELNKKVAIAMLREKFECNIQSATTGEAALEYFSSQFDLVLLDIDLPKMNGFHVAKEMCAQMKAENFSVPIIAMTVHTEIGLETFQEAGIAAVIGKPIMMNTLKEMINKIVFHSRTALS